MNRLWMFWLVLVVAGCAGSPGAKPLSPSDEGYCQSIGLTIGSDAYAECRLKQKT